MKLSSLMKMMFYMIDSREDSQQFHVSCVNLILKITIIHYVHIK